MNILLDTVEELELIGEVDFVTSNLYLDTYFSALHNSVNDKNLNSQTEDAAREYYRYYYDLGMFGDPQLN